MTCLPAYSCLIVTVLALRLCFSGPCCTPILCTYSMYFYTDADTFRSPELDEVNAHVVGRPQHCGTDQREANRACDEGAHGEAAGAEAPGLVDRGDVLVGQLCRRQGKPTDLECGE